MNILVIDTETTGLKGYPKDRVLEIGIAELDEVTGKVTPVYNELIRYDDIEQFDRDYVNEGNGSKGIWIYRNSDMRIEDTLNASKDLDTVVKEVREIVRGRAVTAYNQRFDFRKYLFLPPWELKDIVEVTPDIMDVASEKVYELADADMIGDKGLQRHLLEKRDNSPYENCWVRSNDAYHVLCPDDPMDLGNQTHRALDDAVMESYILRKLL